MEENPLVHCRRDVYLSERDMIRQCRQSVNICDLPKELGAGIISSITTPLSDTAYLMIAPARENSTVTCMRRQNTHNSNDTHS